MGRKFEIIILLLVASYINYLERVSITFPILNIQSEFGFTDEQFGYIFSSFGIGFLFAMFFNGILVDKYGSIRVWAVSAFFWGVFVALTGVCRSFTELFIVRFFLGVSEAFHYPALIKTIADWLDPQLRVRSVAIGLLGVPLALTFGGPFITSLIQTFGFRGMFFVLGGLGIVWSIIWMYCFLGKENPEYNSTGVISDPPKKTPWKSFFTSSFFISNCLIVFFLGYVYFFILNWLPGYLQTTYEVSLTDMGLLTAIPWGLATVLSIVFSILSDSLHKLSQSLRIARSYPIVFASLIAAICFFSLSYRMGLISNLIYLSVGFAFILSIFPMMHALNADLFRVHVGTAESVMMCFIALAAILSPLFTGRLIEHTGFQVVMRISSLFCILSAGIAFFFQRKGKPSG